MKYKELQIVKHSLQHYLNRPHATEKEVAEEKRLLDKITIQVDEMKEKYGIKPNTNKQQCSTCGVTMEHNWSSGICVHCDFHLGMGYTKEVIKQLIKNQKGGNNHA